MRKTLFSKIFLTQIVVALTVVVIIVPMIFVLIGEYFVTVQKDDIMNDAKRVAGLTEQVILMGDNQQTWQMYRSGVAYTGGQSTIIVMSANGEVVISPKDKSVINAEVLEKDFLDGVRDGQSEIKLYDKGRLFNEQSIVAIVPVIKRNRITGERAFQGAAIALRPIPQVRKIQYATVRIILMAQTVAWVVALIVSFIITRQITKPVKRMRLAAKKIAAGDFDIRIPIDTRDEIGDLAESFNSMTQSLGELEEMRTSFLSDVSHELRTPMTVISGFVEGILDGTIPESEHGKYLLIVSEESKRLSRLVKDLLEATRLEQDAKTLNKTNFDLSRLVTESVITYENQLTEKNIALELNLEEKDCFAFADRDAIKRVILNLVDNAIKFTPENGMVKVSTEVIGNKVKMSVENTGEGISKEELRHIWVKFYKSDKSRSVDKKGVGLGLHIVKTIISQHNGEVYAESEEGSFARFTFVLDAGDSKNI